MTNLEHKDGLSSASFTQATKVVVFVALGLTPIVCIVLVFGVIGLISSKETVYAPGFSEQAFDLVTVGMSSTEVQGILGAPIDINNWTSLAPKFLSLADGTNALVILQDSVAQCTHKCELEELWTGRISFQEFQQMHGGVTATRALKLESWEYSRHKDRDGNYFRRTVIVDVEMDKVFKKTREWYWD